MPKVLGIAPDGQKGPVDEANVPEFIRRGGRIATPEEQTAAKLDAEYEAKSLTDKVLSGGIGPRTEAAGAAARRFLTGGVNEAVSKSVRDYIEPGSGAAYAKHQADLEAAHPIPSALGTAGGLGIALLTGDAGPFGLLGKAGAPVGKAAGAVAEKLGASAGGRVAATVAGGARGAFEGGLLAGTEQVAHNITHDSPDVGDKLFSAIGSGILVGGALGAALNLGSHILGARRDARMISSAVDEYAAEGPQGLSKGGVRESPAETGPAADTYVDSENVPRYKASGGVVTEPAPNGQRVGYEPAGATTPEAPPRDIPFSNEPTSPAADGAEASGRPGILSRLATEYGPKVAGKLVGKGVRKAVSAAAGYTIGHFVGGPMAGMAGAAAGSAVSDRMSAAVAKAGGVGPLLEGWGSGLRRAARGVLDSDVPTALVDEAVGGKAVVDAAPTAAEAVTAPHPRATQVARMLTAQAIVKWIGDIRANPTRIQGQLENEAQTVSRAAGPKAAAAYTASTLRAIDYLAAHVPIKERRDPFDPHRLPTLNTNEVDSINRAAHYAAQPWTVYDDFGRGRIYPEGLRAAKTFSPNEFARFQAELQEQTQARVEQDPTLTQAQRLRLMKLLGYPAGATLQRTSITRLQQNMLEPPRASPVGAMGEGSAPSQGAPPAPPIRLTIDHSGFGDNIEARRASGG